MALSAASGEGIWISDHPDPSSEVVRWFKPGGGDETRGAHHASPPRSASWPGGHGLAMIVEENDLGLQTVQVFGRSPPG